MSAADSLHWSCQLTLARATKQQILLCFYTTRLRNVTTLSVLFAGLGTVHTRQRQCYRRPFIDFYRDDDDSQTNGLEPSETYRTETTTTLRNENCNHALLSEWRNTHLGPATSDDGGSRMKNTKTVTDVHTRHRERIRCFKHRRNIQMHSNAPRFVRGGRLNRRLLNYFAVRKGPRQDELGSFWQPRYTLMYFQGFSNISTGGCQTVPSNATATPTSLHQIVQPSTVSYTNRGASGTCAKALGSGKCALDPAVCELFAGGGSSCWKSDDVCSSRQLGNWRERAREAEKERQQSVSWRELTTYYTAASGHRPDQAVGGVCYWSLQNNVSLAGGGEINGAFYQTIIQILSNSTIPPLFSLFGTQLNSSQSDLFISRCCRFPFLPSLPSPVELYCVSTLCVRDIRTEEVFLSPPLLLHRITALLRGTGSEFRKVSGYKINSISCGGGGVYTHTQTHTKSGRVEDYNFINYFTAPPPPRGFGNNFNLILK